MLDYIPNGTHLCALPFSDMCDLARTEVAIMYYKTEGMSAQLQLATQYTAVMMMIMIMMMMMMMILMTDFLVDRYSNYRLPPPLIAAEDALETPEVIRKRQEQASINQPL